MKKIYLTIILGMFLIFSIGFISSAKSFALYEATPPVISVTPQAGGSLVDGTTYHVVLCGTFGISNYYNLGYGRQISNISNEVNFTANATHKSFQINIDTPSTGVTAVQQYIMYFYADTDSDPDFYPTNDSGDAKLNVWGKDNSGNRYIYYGQPVANFPKTIDEDDRATTYSTAPYFVQGQPELQFSGGTWADPIIPENIYDYLVGLGGGEEKYMEKVGDMSKIGIKRSFGYVFYLQLYALNVGTQHFKVPDRETCIFAVVQSFLHLDKFYTGNMAEDGLSHEGDYPTGGGNIYFLGRGGRYTQTRDVVVYNGVVSSAPSTMYTGFYSHHLDDGSDTYISGRPIFEDSNIDSTTHLTGATYGQFDRLNAPGFSTAWGIYPGTTLSDVKLYHEIKTSYASTRNDVTMYQVNQMYANADGDVQIFHYASNDLNFRFYDTSHYSGTLTDSEIFLRTYWRAGWVGANLKVHNGFRLNVHVQNETGSAIENVNVTLTDAYGNVTLTNLTNVGGNITRTDVAKNIWTVTIPNTDAEWGGPSNYRTYQWLYDNYPDVTDFKTYTPFTLTITADNYESVEMIIDPTQDDWFPAGINRDITLESRDWNYSSNLEWMGKNSTNSLFKLDDNGNLAIFGELYENTNSSFINSQADAKFKINDLLVITKDGVLYIKGKFMELIN